MLDFNEQISNIDNKKILNKVAKTWRKVLSDDEINSCKMISVMNAIRYYDPDRKRKRKFTSYLFNFMNWECQKQVKDKNSKIQTKSMDNFDISGSGYSTLDSLGIRDCIDKLDKQEQSLIYFRYFDNMTYREISKEMKCSIETARKKVNMALSNLRTLMEKGDSYE